MPPLLSLPGMVQSKRKNPLEEAYGCGGKWVSDKPKNNRSPF
jgi:hypothetical protein